MNRILLVMLMGISMISHVSNAEHIEISTGIPMILTTPTNAPSEGRYSGTQFLRDVESYLTESTNVKKQSSSPRVDYIGEAMYPVYPGYNAVETINTNIDTVNEKNQTASLFSFMVSALKTTIKAGIQIFGNIFYILMKGAGVLAIGGIITTVVCYFTSICAVKYNGLKYQKDADNGAIRAFMRPDKLGSLAAQVQEAISKYQMLQKST